MAIAVSVLFHSRFPVFGKISDLLFDAVPCFSNFSSENIRLDGVYVRSLILLAVFGFAGMTFISVLRFQPVVFSTGLRGFLHTPMPSS